MTESRNEAEQLGVLYSYVQAAKTAEPSSDQVSAAQRKLMDRLNQRSVGKHSRRNMRRPAVWAASGAACAMVVLVLTLLPTKSSIAFDDVRAFLEHFHSLKTLVTMRSTGDTVWTMEALSDEQGRARIDFDYGMTFVVDPAAGEMMIVNHPSRSVQRIPIASAETPLPGEGQEWLQEIRAFQGTAELIEASREIDGVEVTGYRLNAGRQKIEIWARADSGLPVQVNVRSLEDSSFDLQVDIWLDVPVDPAAFSLDSPSGYGEGPPARG